MSGAWPRVIGGQSRSDEVVLELDPLGLEPIPEDTRQRFLRFQTCADEATLLPLKDIAAVLQVTIDELLPVPDMATWLLGVCNWRGEMLWLVDVNSLLGKVPLWHQNPRLETMMVIVIQAEERSVGLAVEQVDDVELIDPDRIVQSEKLGAAITDPMVAGHLPEHGGIILDALRLVDHSFRTLS
ncbi:chemotaxis protein CheW [Leptothoe kymatousa]|uniref:Chemotaxis protein CheW n=1 Tax=Leptothoe kymatousa TAU-MAC 1615 TaxID=2364775 RepID=A0ABS5Y2G8_9CYAN|nr:chemotaxis protein CheW [Leptothoe kymatousa]MBT9311997.1 chemotaxis protein CheW [Leptothoe kymatousa TAU-MAC 1615]